MSKYLNKYIIICLTIVLGGSVVKAQSLRFGNHRDVAPPEYATLLLGPFYSSIDLTQSVGYRYTSGTGTGTTFLFNNHRGKLKEDGSELPMITTLNFRNYLMISTSTDLDMSFRISYEHYPLETQEDDFFVDMADQGLYGDLSMEFNPTPFVKGSVYDKAIYRVDYIDTRGITDEYGGSRYEYFLNNLGLNIDWLMTPDRNMGLSLSREDNIPFDDLHDDQQRVTYDEELLYEKTYTPFLVGGLKASFAQTDFTANERGNTFLQQYEAYSRMDLTRDTSANASLGFFNGTTSEATSTNNVNTDSMFGMFSLKTQMSDHLSHSLSIGRSVQTGYSSSFEINDSAAYNIQWIGDFFSLRAGSNIHKIDPVVNRIRGYRDWNSFINMNYQLTSYASLQFLSSYNVRANESTAISSITEPEWNNDYTTWVNRVGTGFGITQSIKFLTYLQHVNRSSSESDLSYSRTTFEANLVYNHSF